MVKRRGFTLVEISIYVTLAALFLIGAYRLFISSRRTYTVTTQNMITNEQARKIINYLNFELRRANHVQEPPLLESETDISDENSARLVYIIQRADPSRNPTAGRIFQQTSVELEVNKNTETGLCELTRKKIEYDYNGNASATEESVLYGDIDELKFWRIGHSPGNPQSGPKVVHFQLRMQRVKDPLDSEMKYTVDYQSSIFVRGEKIL